MTNFDQAAYPDSKYWHYASIELHQAALLLGGMEPDGEYREKAYSDLPARVQGWVDILNNAIREGELPAIKIYVVRHATEVVVSLDKLERDEWIGWRTKISVTELKKWHEAHSWAADSSAQRGLYAIDHYPPELRVAIEAFEAVSKDSAALNGRSPKAALEGWLKQHKPELTTNARDRIATVANWQPSGGAPKTPGE